MTGPSSRRHTAAIGLLVAVLAFTAASPSGDAAGPRPPPRDIAPVTASAAVPVPTLPVISLPIPGVDPPAEVSAPTQSPEASMASATAEASLAEFSALAPTVVGPTGDIVAGLSLFVPVPDGIHSPTDATITAFSVDIYPYALGGYYAASVTFTSSANGADLLTFYETTLTAAGLLQTGDTASNDDLAASRTLTFAVPDSAQGTAEIEVSVRNPRSPTMVDTVRLGITDLATSDMLAPFSEWTAGMPLPAGGELSEAGFVVSNDFGLSLSLRSRYDYLNTTAGELETEFEANLPSGGYSLAAADVEDGLTELAGTDLIFATVSFSEGFRADASVNVSAAFELGP